MSMKCELFFFILFGRGDSYTTGNIISNIAYFIISQFFKILFMVRTSFIYL